MPELARDPSEQCSYINPDHRGLDAISHARCLNKATRDLETYPVQPRCDGPHRFTVDAPYSLASVDNVRGWNRRARQVVAMRWATAAFTEEQATNSAQRALRLLEEAVELYQACVHEAGRDAARARAHELVDFVFERPAGEIGQEIGGVSVCLLVLAEAVDLSADACEVKELHRVLSKPVEEFTKRNAAKNAAGFLAITPEQLASDQTYRTISSERERPPGSAVWSAGHGYKLARNVTEQCTMIAPVGSPDWGKRCIRKHHEGASNQLEDRVRHVFGSPLLRELPHALLAAVNEYYTGPELAQTFRKIWDFDGANGADLKRIHRLLASVEKWWHDVSGSPPAPHKDNYVGSFKAFPDRPRTTDFNRATDEEIALFAAAWHHHTVYTTTKDESQHDLRMSLGQLAVAARAWCTAHPNDHRVPTEIAAGVTDKNPTRMHTIKPDGSVPTLGLPVTTVTSHATDHFMQLSSERFRELEEIKRLVGGPHLEYVTGGATALSLVKELVEAHGQAQAVIADLRMFATADSRRISDLLRETQALTAALASAQSTLGRVEQNNELGKLIAAVDAPVPMIMHCPACHQRHVDVAFADHPHHTHACQHCGFSWRPAVANTVGVQFLPGFKDEEE